MNRRLAIRMAAMAAALPLVSAIKPMVSGQPDRDVAYKAQIEELLSIIDFKEKLLRNQNETILALTRRVVSGDGPRDRIGKVIDGDVTIMGDRALVIGCHIYGQGGGLLFGGGSEHTVTNCIFNAEGAA